MSWNGQAMTLPLDVADGNAFCHAIRFVRLEHYGRRMAFDLVTMLDLVYS
jgi:hypothetical protein